MLKSKKNIYIFLSLLFVLMGSYGFINVAIAKNVNSRPSDQTYSQTRPLTQEQSQKAKDWGLKSEEWQRYEKLMQGPLGIYSPNLDPLTALGIEARTEKERRYYAELQAKAESARVQKELAYQRAYDEAFQRIYPSILPISDSMTDTQTTQAAPSRLAIFVKDNCALCDTKIKQLQLSSQEFDVYLVGSRNNDQVVRTWANRVSIDTQKVKDGSITLNHDGGRWLTLGMGGELPAIVREVNGQWLRQ